MALVTVRAIILGTFARAWRAAASRAVGYPVAFLDLGQGKPLRLDTSTDATTPVEALKKSAGYRFFLAVESMCCGNDTPLQVEAGITAVPGQKTQGWQLGFVIPRIRAAIP